MKTIADPLYGSIHITPVESEIISTGAFQRLHNIRQLGQAYLIFPGANYSRFSHSIGALRNAGKLIAAIEKNSSPTLSQGIRDIEQKYRLAALLHDVGHFPFSHATEHAFDSIHELMGINSWPDKFEIVKDHEEFGEIIINNDPQILSILERYKISPEEISNIFRKKTAETSEDFNLKSVISSELDCDRLDYLRRTSHFSGLPFGNVDMDYLISSAELIDGKLCFDSKARRSADHMLIARFHDYLQIVFHKTLVSLEWSLVEAVKACVKANTLEVSKDQLEKVIRNGEIVWFDDNQFLNQIKEAKNYYRDDGDPIKYHIEAVLKRKPAKQVFVSQRYINACSHEIEATKPTHGRITKLVQSIVDEYCRSVGNGLQNFIKVWSVEEKFSKARPEELCGTLDLELIQNQEELVYMKSANENATPLIFYPDSIVGIMARQIYSDVRVFILPIPDFERHRSNLSAKLKEAFKDEFGIEYSY